MKASLRDRLTSAAFLAPFVIIFGLFLAYPLFYSFYLSLNKVTTLVNVFENLKFVGEEMLDRLPNMVTDFSARIRWLGIQPRAARKFFIEYQDRILFGTDVVITESPAKSTDALTDFWLSYRCSLELEEYDFTDRKGEVHHFKGLALPEAVLRKIYHENWQRLLERCGRVVPTAGPQKAAINAG